MIGEVTITELAEPTMDQQVEADTMVQEVATVEQITLHLPGTRIDHRHSKAV